MADDTPTPMSGEEYASLEDIEFSESEAMVDTSMLPAFMTIVLLFGAAVQGANRDQRKALYEARQMLKNKAPLRDVAQAIMDARGPEWEVPAVTMEAIEALHDPSK